MQLDLMNRATAGRLASSVVTVFVLAPMLMGCESLMEDSPPIELAVQVDDGVFAVANCDAAIAGQFRLRTGEQTDSRYRNFFVGDAGDGWQHEEVLRVDSDKWTQVEMSLEPELKVGRDFLVLVLIDGSGRVARFVVPERGVPQDAWLRSDGTTTAAPCGE